VSTSRQRLEALIFFGLFDPNLRSFCIDKFDSLSAPSKDLSNIFARLRHGNTITNKLSAEIQNLKNFLNPTGTFDVDLESHVIYQSQQRPMTSVALANLLILLSSRPSVPFPEILTHCFGISDYNSEIHSTKVHNLLFRLRKIIGNHAFYSRREVVFVIEMPKELRFLRPSAFQSLLAQSPQWKILKKELLGLFNNDPANLILILINDHDHLTRKTLQQLTGLSKASVSRHIKKLIELDHLAYTRKGSAPVYFLKK
jgi:hypothetical protein